jgi:vacuolar-type H+-ATPase subunit H
LLKRGGQRGRSARPKCEITTVVDDEFEEDALVAEAIQRIREAEKAAEESGRQARAQGKRLIAEAHEASERMLDEMRADAWEEEKTLTTKAREEAEAEAERMVAESRTSVERVRSSAEKRIEAGVKKVLHSITAAA